MHGLKIWASMPRWEVVDLEASGHSLKGWMLVINNTWICFIGDILRAAIGTSMPTLLMSRQLHLFWARFVFFLKCKCQCKILTKRIGCTTFRSTKIVIARFVHAAVLFGTNLSESDPSSSWLLTNLLVCAVYGYPTEGWWTSWGLKLPVCTCNQFIDSFSVAVHSRFDECMMFLRRVNKPQKVKGQSWIGRQINWLANLSGCFTLVCVYMQWVIIREVYTVFLVW